MRFTNENSIMTLFLEGELNSYNADNVDKEIEQLLANQKFLKLVLDFSHISYISSAGLRVILKLKQRYQDVSVIEVSLEVYDIFSMTGFTNIMDIKKGLRRIYLSGAEVIGDGYFSTVYRIDKDTIIKVFNHTSDIEQIERELKLAKLAFVLGIPTAISFDIVKVDDGKLGGNAWSASLSTAESPCWDAPGCPTRPSTSTNTCIVGAYPSWEHIPSPGPGWTERIGDGPKPMIMGRSSGWSVPAG